ncbi:MAG: SPOR domain-containing protein [Spirochaetaceae bacterium]|jgi:hypothetical protein|nr:SPOR domain-containing protein [Spirochaetaceae bacterium]
MYKKLAIQIAVILLSLLPAMQVFAGGVKSPNLVVETPSETSRLISLDWSVVSNAARYRWGLYRFDLEEKSFTLIDELAPLQSSYLDEDLEPPLLKYYYKVEHVSQKGDLEKTKPQRLNRNDIQEQLASAVQIPISIPPPIIEPPPVETAVNNTPAEVAASNDDKEKKDATYWDIVAENTMLEQKPTRNSLLNEGIYIGVISFSGKTNDITHNPDGSPALILLDGAGRQALLENLARGYTPSKSSGTALYYADHKALANLSKMNEDGSLPGNIDSVTIITFTDGIDTSSTDVNFTPLEGRQFKNTNAYNAFIRQQLSSSAIRQRLPGVKKINAWSIGIPGKDVQNNVEFGRGLQAVGPDDFSEFTNVSQIEKVLLDIANKLLITYKPRINFTLSTPAYPVGTRLRITFDGYVAESSSNYIDARIGLDETGKSYVLNITEQSGMKLADDKRRLEGKRAETGIDYTIMLADEFQEAKVKQWYMQPGEELFGWMQDSEFATNKTADFTYERKSEVIYLVLDSSSSLSETEIDRIRSAIGVFINRLYSALYDPSERNSINPLDRNAAKRSDAQTYASTGKSPQAVSEFYIQTYKPEDAGQPPQAATEIVIQKSKPEPARNPPQPASTYQTQTYGQSTGTNSPPQSSSTYQTQIYGQSAETGSPPQSSSTYQTQIYGQSAGTGSPSQSSSTYQTQIYGQSAGTGSPPQSAPTYQTQTQSPPVDRGSTIQRPQIPGQTAGTASPPTAPTYQTQIYGQSAGAGSPPTTSAYQPQTQSPPVDRGSAIQRPQIPGQVAGTGSPQSAPTYQTQIYGQSAGTGSPPSPASEIIIQTYKQSDAVPRIPQVTIPSTKANESSEVTSRVPQVTIPSIQINKSQGGSVKTPAIQPRPDNRVPPPPAISTTVPVIEVFSISNAPVNVSSRNGYWVQLGSYSDANHAQRSWRAFSNTGMGSAEIFSTNVNGRTYYRVKAGPYSSKTDAEQALVKLKNYSPVYNDSFITNE